MIVGRMLFQRADAHDAIFGISQNRGIQITSFHRETDILACEGSCRAVRNLTFLDFRRTFAECFPIRCAVNRFSVDLQLFADGKLRELASFQIEYGGTEHESIVFVI